MYTGYLPSGNVALTAATGIVSAAAGASSAPVVNQTSTDALYMLSKAGLNPTEIVIAVPMLFFAPAYTDPASSAAGILVKAIQTSLKAKGYPVSPNGKIAPGDATDVSLNAICGTQWRFQKTWNAIVLACISALPYKVLQDQGIVEAPKSNTGMFVLAAVGIGAFLLLKGKR
jgi:hypothetical protein